MLEFSDVDRTVFVLLLALAIFVAVLPLLDALVDIIQEVP